MPKKTNSEGTGLGLYIVKSIIEQAKGSVYFDSPYSIETTEGKEERSGTIFYVKIPLAGMEKNTN